MKEITPVSEIRQLMGNDPRGGTAKPISPAEALEEIESDSKSALEKSFARRWNNLYPYFPFRGQYLFHPTRDFRLDFAWPLEGPDIEKRISTGGISLEIQGGIWKKSTKGHNGGTGLLKSYEKLNYAQMQNWIVFQFSDKEIKDSQWLERLAHCIRYCGWYGLNYERSNVK